MQLTQAETNTEYPHLRMVSENGVWELGIGQLTIYGGIRIVTGKQGRGYEINYCAGQNQEMALRILTLLFAIMSKMPEIITFSEFRKAFPKQSIKPMDKDPKCYEALVEVARHVEKLCYASKV